MTRRPATLLLLTLLLSGCVNPAGPPYIWFGPPHEKDLAALEACATRHDALDEEIQTEVWWSLHEGHALPAIVGGMELIAARQGRIPDGLPPFAPEAPELWYAKMMRWWPTMYPAHPLGWDAAVQAGPRLTELRRCLAAKGYTFAAGATPTATAAAPPAPPRRVSARDKILACTAEARATGADPKAPSSPYWVTFHACFDR
jgi:hypothetical protein